MAAPIIALDGAWGARVRPQTFDMLSGDDRTLTVTLRDRNGDVVDVDGTFSWVLVSGKLPGDGIRTTKTGTVTDGVFSIPLVGSDTTDLDGAFYHEAEVIETSSGAKSIGMSGHIRIGEDAA